MRRRAALGTAGADRRRMPRALPRVPCLPRCARAPAPCERAQTGEL